MHIIKGKLYLVISGKNPTRFIKRLNTNGIDILKISYLSKDKVKIKIYKKDYEKILDIKTTYEIDIVNYGGILKIKKKIYFNKFIIIFILLGLSIVIFLSNIIFEIEIVTNDNKMKEKLITELNNNGLSIYKFKKSYNDLQKIKSKILKKYKNEIDWIEIENVGTKYIIRYEPRLESEQKENNILRNIVAKKSAVIYSLDVSSGQIIKNRNSYVKKGDIIVSGYIYLNDTIKDTISSKGQVLGEVWYEVQITYPLKYYEERKTGKNKNVYIVRLLNKDIELFNFNKYKNKKTKDNVILKSNILPFYFIKQKQEEMKIIKEKNNYKEAISKAIKLGKKKISDNLGDNEFILDYKVLETTKNKDSVTVNIFYSVVEDIGEYQEIEEYKLEENDISNN